MRINPARILRGALWRVGNICIGLAGRIRLNQDGKLTQIPQENGEWTTCRIGDFEWRLNRSQFIDRELFDKGVFEPTSISWVRKLVKPGMIVADVGANFGYYTVLLSSLVGPGGQVHAFEPSKRYCERLLDHVRRNECDNVTVSNFGLSDTASEKILYGDEISAALDWADDAKPPTIEEPVQLRTLDSYAVEIALPSLDFMKVDIDGHEPRFLVGATQTIQRFRPMILMEFAQLNLMAAGSDVEHLVKQLSDLGYSCFSETNGNPYSSHADFLREAMNCSHSVNVFCLPGQAGAPLEQAAKVLEANRQCRTH